MPKDNAQLAKFVHQRIDGAMGCLMGPDSNQLRWFHCFGTMLEYVADRTFGLKFDIDIGIYYEEYNPKQIAAAFESFGYKLDRVFVNDRTGTPLNMHFAGNGGPLAGTPEVDVYAFVKRGKERIYSYDIDDEGREVPKHGYTFKRVPEGLLCGPAAAVEHYTKAARPGSERLLNRFGIWNYSIWEDHGPYTMRIPWAYGTLCDLWYPGWRFRENYRGQSMGPEPYKVKSCGELI